MQENQENQQDEQNQQNPNLYSMNIILDKQKELMARVPHPLREDAHRRMLAIASVFEKFLLYLTSTGHKPWRPYPLDELVQKERFVTAVESIDDIDCYIDMDSKKVDTTKTRLLVSTFGTLEESLEFYRASVNGDSNTLEEITDELFFFMEKMILSGFTWEQIIQEYHRKWAVNIKRYEDAEKNDFSWDDRSRKSEL